MQRLSGASLLVFANKTDINGCMNEQEIQEVCRLDVEKNPLALIPFQGLQLDVIKTHEWHVMRCSAITGTNLQEGLAWVVQDAKKRLFLY